MTALINDYGAALVKAIGIHTVYVLVSVAIGFALGLVLGVLLSRIPQWSGVILPLLSIFKPFRAWCSSGSFSSGGAWSIPR